MDAGESAGRLVGEKAPVAPKGRVLLAKLMVPGRLLPPTGVMTSEKVATLAGATVTVPPPAAFSVKSSTTSVKTELVAGP